jgi:hypothetical protein
MNNEQMKSGPGSGVQHFLEPSSGCFEGFASLCFYTISGDFSQGEKS